MTNTYTTAVTVPVDGAVMVVTQDEVEALQALLQQLDSMTGVTLSQTHLQAIYQLAREVREI